jgi:hypothetical protein
MSRAIAILFSLTTFLASVLLFTAEPMIGKMVLPLFGGTPAVWNTCLVYFQLVLLCGYGVCFGLQVARAHEHRAVWLCSLLLLGLALTLAGLSPPIAADPSVGSPDLAPVFRVFRTLVDSATLPLCLVAVIAPLVQVWFSLTDHSRSRDPYFLYAASNAGSLLALVAYPFAIEPNTSLGAQARLWQGGFVGLATLILICGFLAWGMGRRRLRGADTTSDDANPASPVHLSLRTSLEWLVLVFIPSSWLMGVTAYLTTDLAPMPLLWVIPLALYLLSFVVAFAGPGWKAVRLAATVLPVCALIVILVLSAGFVHAFWVPLHLLTFFAGSVACHGALARRRPPARWLSIFYVAIALGGLLGGVFNALLAPLLFDRVVEYPLAIVLGCMVAGGMDDTATFSPAKRLWGDLVLPGAVFGLVAALVTDQAGLADSGLGALAVIVATGLVLHALRSARRRPLRFALAAGAVVAASGLTQGPNGRLLHIERNFFGVVRVTEDDGHTVHRMFHGSTLHGQQTLDPALARDPSTYFTRSGPIGQVFAALAPRLEEPGTRLAIVGLGAGTLAAYGHPQQAWTFFEIDPAIERIARDPRFFTYLRECPAQSLDVVLGDARLRLREAPDGAYRLIVLDAFSSDSLPVHLVTREALRLYRSKLAEGGVLAFNLSNRYLDLDPLMGRQAEDADLICRIRYDLVIDAGEHKAGKQASIWAVMAATEADLGGLYSDPRWRPPRTRPGSRAWTDDFSDLARYFRWRQEKIQVHR